MSEVRRDRDRGYRDLIAWQKGVELVGAVYRTTESWPRDEQFGLTNQVRRAVVSVPANIAEGKGRTGSREFLHHLPIAHGSLCEVETHLHIANHLAYLDHHALDPLLDQSAEVGRLIRGIMKRLRQQPI
ncbi:MAG TPA: four helix bundle protein [Thermomicrobiales bacterium]|nr:four helix bundle protein [Thermomicrobiales bacterium]